MMARAGLSCRRPQHDYLFGCELIVRGEFLSLATTRSALVSAYSQPMAWIVWGAMSISMVRSGWQERSRGVLDLESPARRPRFIRQAVDSEAGS